MSIFIINCDATNMLNPTLTNTTQDKDKNNDNNPVEEEKETTKENNQDKEKDKNADDDEITDEDIIKNLYNRFIPVLIILGSAFVLILIINFISKRVRNYFMNRWDNRKGEHSTENDKENIESIINLVKTTIRLVVLLIAIFVSLNVLQLVEFPAFKLSSILNWFLNHGVNIIITVIAIYVLLKLVKVILNRIKISLLSKYEKDPSIQRIDKTKKAETLTKLAGYILKVLIWVSGVFIILGELSINLGPIIASAGVVGVAVALGSQNLVKDVLKGAFILLENQFHIGDVISVAGVGGLVEEFNIRYTRIRNLSGSVFFIPNGEISVVENMTKEWSRAVVDISIAYKENVDYVMNVIEEVGVELSESENFKKTILEPLSILGVNELGDSGVVIRTLIKTLPLEQWGVAREINRRIKNKFDEKGIEIPFPHMTVAIGDEAKQGHINVMMKHLDTDGAESKRIKEIKDNTKSKDESIKSIDPTKIYGNSDEGEGDVSDVGGNAEK